MSKHLFKKLVFKEIKIWIPMRYNLLHETDKMKKKSDKYWQGCVKMGANSIDTNINKYKFFGGQSGNID